jgi:hypothetical protein
MIGTPDHNVAPAGQRCRRVMQEALGPRRAGRRAKAGNSRKSGVTDALMVGNQPDLLGQKVLEAGVIHAVTGFAVDYLLIEELAPGREDISDRDRVECSRVPILTLPEEGRPFQKLGEGHGLSCGREQAHDRLLVTAEALLVGAAHIVPMPAVVVSESVGQLVDVVHVGVRERAARDVAQHVNEVHEVAVALGGEHVHELVLRDPPQLDARLQTRLVSRDLLTDVGAYVVEVPRVVIGEVEVLAAVDPKAVVGSRAGADDEVDASGQARG